MKKLSAVVDKGFHILAAIGFTCVMFCVLVQILARYLTFIYAPWTDELSRLSFMYTMMVACPMSIRYHEYASIDAISSKLKGKMKTVLALLVDVVIVVVCAVGIPQGRLYYFVGTKSLSTSLHLNLGLFYVVPLGIFVLTLVFTVIDIISECLILFKGEGATEE